MIVINKGQKIIEGDVGKLMSSESIKISIKQPQIKKSKTSLIAEISFMTLMMIFTLFHG